MITGTRRIRGTVEYSFDLPMNAREINDAIWQVNAELKDVRADDVYHVKSDGESLIFYWEGGTE